MELYKKRQQLVRWIVPLVSFMSQKMYVYGVGVGVGVGKIYSLQLSGIQNLQNKEVMYLKQTLRLSTI